MVPVPERTGTGQPAGRQAGPVSRFPDYARIMTPHEAAEVFALFAEADAFDSALIWRVDMASGAARETRLFAECNDLFHWACADFEEIAVDDVPLLRRTLDDLKPLSAEYELGHLFAARKRGLRPQRPCYKDMEPAVAALYDACCTEAERDAASERDAAWWIAAAHRIKQNEAGQADAV